MSARLRAPRRAVLVFAVAAALAGLAIVLAALRPLDVRTFALRVQDSVPVAVVQAKRTVCEGLVASPRAAQGVGIFGAPKDGRPVVHVILRTARGHLLTTGELPITGGGEHLVALRRPLAGRVAAEVCLRADGGRFSLLGAGAVAGGVVTRNVASGMQFALVLVRRASFLASLGTAFSRAAVLRPDWVGAWTFWVLLAGVLVAFGLGGLAIASADGGDGADEEEDFDRHR